MIENWNWAFIPLLISLQNVYFSASFQQNSLSHLFVFIAWMRLNNCINEDDRYSKALKHFSESAQWIRIGMMCQNYERTGPDVTASVSGYTFNFFLAKGGKGAESSHWYDVFRIVRRLGSTSEPACQDDVLISFWPEQLTTTRSYVIYREVRRCTIRWASQIFSPKNKNGYNHVTKSETFHCLCFMNI